MKVLIPHDIKGLHSFNPYDVQLIKGLENSGCYVDNGLFRLMDNDKSYDVISFQWPEYILPFSPPPSEIQLKQFENRLKVLKKKSVIVSTIHNEMPHNLPWSRYQKVYELIYKYSDGFIHFGKKSIDIIKSQFGYIVRDKDHVVIPHGNYSYFGERKKNTEAKKKLGLSEQVIVLHIGAIRKMSELHIIYSVAQEISKTGGNFIIQSTVNIPRVKVFGIQSSILMKRFKQEAQIRKLVKKIKRLKYVNFNESKVSFEDMSTLISAADILLIPRVDSLNSGNVPLGFSYGCIVLGPDIGNIGEILRDNNNPVFSPSEDREDLVGALKKSFIAVKSGIGENNYSVAINEWDWNLIGLRQKKFFEHLLLKRNALC